MSLLSGLAFQSSGFTSTLTVSDLEFYQGLPPEVAVEEIAVDEFLETPSLLQWKIGTEKTNERKWQKFLELKSLLESNLKNFQGFQSRADRSGLVLARATQ
jgi:hypothetical protein